MTGKTANRLAIWRSVCLAGLVWMALLFASEGARREVGAEPFWYCIALGVVPSVAVIISARFSPRVCYRLALGHDLLLALGLLVGLAVLPNYFALVVMYPLGVFIIEGVVLFIAIRRNRSLTSE